MSSMSLPLLQTAIMLQHPVQLSLWADSKLIINTIQKIPILYDFFWSTSALSTITFWVIFRPQQHDLIPSTANLIMRCNNISHPDTNTVSVFIKPQALTHCLITADMWAIHVDLCVGISPVRQHGIYYLLLFFYQLNLHCEKNSHAIFNLHESCSHQLAWIIENADVCTCFSSTW